MLADVDPSARDEDLSGPMPDDLATLWSLIRRVAAAMDRQGEALFRRELGISLAQFLVLSVVDAYPGPLSQQAIADRLGLTKGTVSRQIDNAVKAGLMTVGVAPHSRRENVVALTDDGAALVRRGDALASQSRAGLLKVTDTQDTAATLEILQDLLHALQS